MGPCSCLEVPNPFVESGLHQLEPFLGDTAWAFVRDAFLDQSPDSPDFAQAFYELIVHFERKSFRDGEKSVLIRFSLFVTLLCNFAL